MEAKIIKINELTYWQYVRMRSGQEWYLVILNCVYFLVGLCAVLFFIMNKINKYQWIEYIVPLFFISYIHSRTDEFIKIKSGEIHELNIGDDKNPIIACKFDCAENIRNLEYGKKTEKTLLILFGFSFIWALSGACSWLYQKVPIIISRNN